MKSHEGPLWTAEELSATVFTGSALPSGEAKEAHYCDQCGEEVYRIEPMMFKVAIRKHNAGLRCRVWDMMQASVREHEATNNHFIRKGAER